MSLDDTTDDYQRPFAHRPAPAPADPRTGDATLASLEASPVPDFSTGVIQLERLTAFSYTSSALQLADPFAVSVPDPRAQFTDKLLPGWSVRFCLTNPSVAGGTRTLKATGIITQREARSEPRGTVLQLTGADLGWHLMHNDAPLWFNLRGVSLEDLAKACIFPQRYFKTRQGQPVADPKWGFQGITTSNADNRKLKARLKFTPSENEAFKAAQRTLTKVWVQVQPGQKISDLLILYARRCGLLVGVTADGTLVLWLPNDGQQPAYVIRHRRDQERGANNVQSARRSDGLDSVYTSVMVVGEKPYLNIAESKLKVQSPNAGKFRGRFSDPTALPSAHQIIFTDCEMTGSTADARAQWKAQRGLFDAHTLTYQVRGHHQNGVWWESDTMCEVHDDVLGVVDAQGQQESSANYYVAAVQCQRDMQTGDVTTVTLKRPGLLGALG